MPDNLSQNQTNPPSFPVDETGFIPPDLPSSPKPGQPSSFTNIPLIVTPPPKKHWGKGALVGSILALIILLFGLIAGLILIPQQQEIRERAKEDQDDDNGDDDNGDDDNGDDKGSVSCNQPNQKWATDLGLIKDSGKVEKAKGSPYFVRSSSIGKFTIDLPSGYSISKITCYDCDHYDEDKSKGWKINWNGGSLLAKTPNNTWGSWNVNIAGPNSVFFDGGGDSHGGNACVNLSPTSPPVSSSCLAIKTFDTDWNELTAAQLSTLKAGNKVRFSVAGTTTSGNFDKAKFTINGTQRPETTTVRPGTTEFYDEYVIPAGVTSFDVGAEIHHQQLNQWFK